MSTSNASKSKPAAFLRPDDFTVERVFPIRNLVGQADIPELSAGGSDSVSELNMIGNYFGTLM